MLLDVVRYLSRKAGGVRMTTKAKSSELELLAEIHGELKKLNKAFELQRIMPSTPVRLKHLAVEDSARYIYENYPHVQTFIYRHETVDYAVGRAKAQGLFLEFGVDTGGTINQIARLAPKRKVFGFDSFEGLPEDWGGTSLLQGRFDRQGKKPKVPRNVTLVKGWFDETIPKWKLEHEDHISLCHVDCDLYSSTATIFQELEERFCDGTIILFDEYFGYSDWRNGEHKAFLEMIERTGFKYRALAVSHMALVVELFGGPINK